MSGILTFLPKEDQRLPDHYGIKIYYLTGKCDEFQLASHVYSKETDMIEFWTKENLLHWVPMNAVAKIEFDSNFSKIIEIKNDRRKENNSSAV